jgi:hypothetical protein
MALDPNDPELRRLVLKEILETPGGMTDPEEYKDAPVHDLDGYRKRYAEWLEDAIGARIAVMTGTGWEYQCERVRKAQAKELAEKK